MCTWVNLDSLKSDLNHCFFVNSIEVFPADILPSDLHNKQKLSCSQPLYSVIQ